MLKPFLVFYGAALLIQFAGNYFTMMSVKTWYPTLVKSALTPPGYVFGIVWTILYILMSIAAWRVYRKEQRGYFSQALKLWWL
jgi:tryptophan-rich sensory protein